ncbi:MULTISPECIES: hypothetical protein [Streptomyces]|uniref:Secreted protein n=1 Tax=Streptomyces sudanensis TaxID=436397 RepID=A0ABY4TD15_9ACTN|nr:MULTISPECIES: hypothetical protein [Streptomyces]MCP9988025.1 hypothetical protein [Streptomyces sudanensis]URN16153.1 hypothetical protein MW084_09545 [Streptomyces sudanensis]
MFGWGTGARRGRIAVAAGVAAVAVAGVVATAGPGTAAVHAGGSAGCSGRLAKAVRFATGELRVYKNRQYACAVTVAKAPGARRPMAVTLQSRGGRAVTDTGRFTHRAGAVTVHTLNRCVRATGSVSGRGGATGWILC